MLEVEPFQQVVISTCEGTDFDTVLSAIQEQLVTNDDDDGCGDVGGGSSLILDEVCGFRHS